MNHLLWMAPLLLMHQSHNQKPPLAFYEIPEEIRERATVVVSATYSQGRTPCMLRPDGTRVWAIDSSFHIKRLYRGEVRTKFFSINASMLPASRYVEKRLEAKKQYLVLLQPNPDKMKALKKGDGIYFSNSLRGAEIVAIVEIK